MSSKNEMLLTYVNITEGKSPESTKIVTSQNTKSGTLHILHEVKMSFDKIVYYIETLDDGALYIFKASITNILEIFGSEITETLFSKKQIEEHLKDESEEI